LAEDYNSTLNLPKTDFQMRASLPTKEPTLLNEWKAKDLYNSVMKHNEGKPLFVLHDGPPYANGNIHIGTAMNKILKDFINRYKNLSGNKAPYVPGWDTHGLPTELIALKTLGLKRDDLTPLEIRKHCRQFALDFIDKMTEQFKRLGVIADWEDPYITLKPEFEAIQVKIFGEMAKKGYIYKGLKSVYWCPTCVTALAEAEIEYSDDECESIYVRFNVSDDNGVFAKHNIPSEKAYMVIWTTTTWTIPANVAICVNPDFEYDIAKVGDEYYVMAHELMPQAMGIAHIDNYEVVATVMGSELEGVKAYHPFLDRKSQVVNGDLVTLETGTGCVHIAPGHGVEDFDLITKNYPDIPVLVPVDDNGVLTAEAGPFAGLTTNQANIAIRDHMIATKNIIATHKIVHQYPHCWRCKNPILFRATEQWFCSVDDFKDETVDAIGTVNWMPAWSKDRIIGMVRDRNDWCISRQRSWGVPIPAFYCKDCGEYLINDDTINAVSELFKKEGSDAWYIHEASELLPVGTKCPYCGCGEFTKDDNIMDVWFDSGSSHLAVLNERPNLKWPCDLYLEGADQYRGWFQSSLLTSVAVTGKAPYENVLSHGWVVDGEGRKMSKSLGNGIAPEEVVEAYGADILRLWVASCDYRVDMRISKDILKQLSEAYRKIRNTARFILGNLGDFNPDTDSVSADKLEELDRWALNRLNDLIVECNNDYQKYEFHGVYHALHNFCVVDMSNFYLDIVKDRLYVEAKDSVTRRAAQTVIYHVLCNLTLLIAPILCFTAEEIWKFIPKTDKYNFDSVMFNEIPKSIDVDFNDELKERWNKIFDIRDKAKKALESARNSKFIGASLEAKLVIYTEKEYDFVSGIADMLPQLCITSAAEVINGTGGDYTEEGSDIGITVEKAAGEKCERCWNYSITVGQDNEHPTLCARCRKIIG